jgi:hypothetical protein
MDMWPPNDQEWDTLPHVFLTGDDVWNPSCNDDKFTIADLLLNAPPDTGDQDPCVNDFGQCTGNLAKDIDLIIHECRTEHAAQVVTEDALNVLQRRINQRTVSKAAPNLAALCPNFGWSPLERVKETIQNTAQFARNVPRLPFRKHCRTCWPAANVDRWNKDAATDAFFSDTPAHDDTIMGHSGCTMAQIHAGKQSSRLVACGMISESQMPNALEDLICKHGAPNCLFSDNAKVQIGACVRGVLRLYKIKDFQCETEHQNQNFAERKVGDVKCLSSAIMDRAGTPAAFWLLCLFYMVFLLNHMSSEALGGITPLEAATGVKADISPLLQFHWWEPVFYQADAVCPSESCEQRGTWVGFAETQGNILAYLVLADNAQQVIAGSNVRSALDPNHPNLRASDPLGDVEAVVKPTLSSLRQT